jgi:hypothetical protein
VQWSAARVKRLCVQKIVCLNFDCVASRQGFTNSFPNCVRGISNFLSTASSERGSAHGTALAPRLPLPLDVREVGHHPCNQMSAEVRKRSDWKSAMSFSSTSHE